MKTENKKTTFYDHSWKKVDKSPLIEDTNKNTCKAQFNKTKVSNKS